MVAAGVLVMSGGRVLREHTAATIPRRDACAPTEQDADRGGDSMVKHAGLLPGGIRDSRL